MTDVEKAKTLEERVTERLHASIGDLITEDDLRSMVERGIEKALFHSRTTKTRYGHGTDTKPPLVDEMVEKHLEEEMRKAVRNWIQENPEKMEEAVRGAVERGAGEAMLRVLDVRFASIFTAGVEQMQYQGILPNP